LINPFIPIKTPKNHKTLPTTSDQQQCSGAKPVLLVEDSPDDEFIFLEIIRKSGLNSPVMVVRDGDEAISYLKRDGPFADPKAYPMPSVLFLDLSLPKVSGFEVLRWIKAQPHLKEMLLIVITHSNEVSIINMAYQLGAHSFLTKPLTLAELNNLMAHRQSSFHGCDHQFPPGASLQADFGAG
jgi:CheY-like chemotaxis protein